MEPAEITMQREANKIPESVVGNNRKFDWKFALWIRILSDDRIK